MSIRLTCNCKTILSVADEFAGRRVRCPKCLAVVNVAPLATPQQPPPLQMPVQFAAKPPSRTLTRPDSLTGPTRSASEATAPIAGAIGAFVSEHHPVNQTAKGLGFASLIIGSVALVLSIIPCLGMFSIPLSAIGLTLGFGGILFVLAKRGSGLGFAIGGSAVSTVALGIGLMWLALASAALTPRTTYPVAAGPRPSRPVEARVAADPPAIQAGDAKEQVTQEDFVKLVESFIEPYKAATNDVKKTSLRIERQKAIEKAVGNPNVTKWAGTILLMATSQRGDVAIRVRLAGANIVSLRNLESSFLGAPTGLSLNIANDSPMFKVLAELNKGDTIFFSGEFVIRKQSLDYLAENSWTEKGSMTSPEFAFRFTDISRGHPSPEKVDRKDAVKDDAKDGDWPDASTEAALRGDIKVRVLNARIGYVTGKTFEKFTSKEKQLIIRIEIENLSETRKVEYRGWGIANSINSAKVATLHDKFGNRYHLVRFGFGTRIDDQLDNASLYPGKSVRDVVVFQPPVEKADYVRLELPASATQGSGSFRFQIPRSMITEGD